MFHLADPEMYKEYTIVRTSHLGSLIARLSHLHGRVANFFVSAFWKDYKAQAALTSDQLRRLGNEQYDDMRIR